ncbi:MAG: hypothetical protein GY946_16655, partial [bacterium]|nr:hypothetical protein [bacterium]
MTDSPSAALLALLGEDEIEMARVAAFLDGLTHVQRVEATRNVGRKPQQRLYRAAQGFAPVRLEELVPPGVGDGKAVRHFGKNSLPAFTQFEKRFCRPPGQDPEAPDELWGFNHGILQPLTGPGYYVARPSPDAPEVLVDYNRVPPEAPSGWPPLAQTPIDPPESQQSEEFDSREHARAPDSPPQLPERADAAPRR